MTLAQEIGNRIRQARIKAGWSQRKLAQKLDLTDGAISSFELGDSLPSIKTAVALVKLLEISLDWLFTGATLDAKNETQELSESEIEIIIAWRKATKTRREIALEVLKNESRKNDGIRRGDKKNKNI